MAQERAVNSPFPGMDPYLQAHWPGVHTRLITYAGDALQPQLPDDLVARVEENVRLDVSEELLALRSPDVYVVEASGQWQGGSARTQSGAVAINEPVILEIDHDPWVERHLEIREATGGKVITAIEILSPWNKADGAGRDEYLKKREQYLAARTNLVEIDLIRGGTWYTMVPPHVVPAKHRTTYRVTVKRGNVPGRLELYPIPLWQKLPIVRVPLRPGEADVTLDLQALIEQVYRNGRYNRTEYGKACDPPLTGEEAAWAEETLKAAGRR